MKSLNIKLMSVSRCCKEIPPSFIRTASETCYPCRVFVKRATQHVRESLRDHTLWRIGLYRTARRRIPRRRTWQICAGPSPAGTSQKLERIRDSSWMLPDLPIIIADSHETQKNSLPWLAQARTVISTVGPYAQYGTPLLETCAKEGTHYCDLTGEAQWMAGVFEQINPSHRRVAPALYIAAASTPFPLICLSTSCSRSSRRDTDATPVTFPGAWVARLEE